ncbi:hypothetical protein F511_06831 [Dorcoceras hygrometricum]|uniref:Uncharacterized protein n=1 Tax=Dorcoceras hygrometricum TaxID=472368 RepID=A0A2Z7AFA8_9LAMI|nr:hypothetical protein F511_06831 [Dorcoceras hygrometricum]
MAKLEASSLQTSASEAMVAQIQVEKQKMKEDAKASWARRKEDFLNSSEFDEMCSSKAMALFEHGFNGCLAQFRANGYSETGHPTPFMSILQAMEDMPEEGEVEAGQMFKERIPTPDATP